MRASSCRYLLLLPLWFSVIPLLAQTPAADELRSQVARQPAGPARAAVLTRLAEETARVNGRAALHLAQQAVAEATADPATHAAALGQLGLLYLPIGRYDSAASCFTRQQALAARLPRHPTAKAAAVANQATLQAARAEMAAALDGFTQALGLADSAADWRLTARAAYGAGAACSNMGLNDRADVYLIDAARAAAHADDSATLAQAWRERGFLRMRAHDSAGTAGWAARALAVQRRQGDLAGQGRTYSLRGNLLNVTGHYAAAEAEYQQAARRLAQAGDSIRLAYTEVNRGINFRSWQDYPRSLAVYERARQLCRVLGDRRGRREALTGLASTYAAMGSFEPAYRFARDYANLRDSILNDNFSRQVAEADTRYQAERSAQQARIRTLEVREQKAVVRRRTSWIAALGATLLAVLVAGAALLSRARWRQRVAVEAERRQQERARAAAVIEAEERERRRIGADLHDGVGQLLSAAKLNLSSLQHDLNLRDPAQQAQLATSLDTIDESLREVRTLSHQLVPNALLRQGLVAAVRELVQRATAPSGLTVRLDAVGLERGLPPATEAVVYRILQELITNVVRHSHADDVVLQLVHHGPELNVLLEDNGIGFDVAAAQARSDAGIGLRNLFSRVEYLGGRLDIDSRPGRGTIVTLEIPVVMPMPTLVTRLTAGVPAGAALVLFSLGTLAQTPAVPPAKQQLLDSLHTVLRRPGPLPDSVRISTTYELALTWRRLHPDSAQLYSTRALTLARAARRPRQEAAALGLLGALAKDKGDFPTAVRYQYQSLTISEHIGNLGGQCTAHNDLGIVYKNQHQYPDALKHYQQSLALAEQLAGRPGPKQAYFAGAVAYTLNNIGTIHFDQGQFAAARPFYERALAQARRIGNIDAEATALTNLGGLEAETQHHALAADYFRQALAIDEREGNLYGQASDLVTLGEMHTILKQFPQAEAALSRAAALARQMESLPMRKEVQLRLARLYHARGDEPRAYAAQVTYTALSDSLYTVESAEKQAEMSARFETAKKEQQNRVQALQLSQQRLIIRKRELQLLALLLGVLGALLIAWLVRNRARLRLRLIAARERETQQRERAAAVMEAEEHERRRIGADLHDGVGQLLSAAKLNLSSLQHEASGLAPAPAALLTSALDTLDESLREVRALSHQLVPNALLRQGLVAAVRELVNKMRSPGGLRIELEALGLEQRLPPAVENTIYRAIQEVVSNVVHHSHADKVLVQLVGRPEELSVLIEDNGIGFDVAAAQARPDAGIGLRNLFSRIEYLGGRLDIDSRPGRGTIVTIEVPLTEEAPLPPTA